MDVMAMNEKKVEGFRGEFREMHEAVCSECGNMTKVPFNQMGFDRYIAKNALR